MNDETKNTQLLEIYKLHAGAADDVSRRRDSANRMYLVATTSLGITLGVIARFGTGEIPAWIVLTALSALGILLQMGWLGVIKSYRQLNQGKFAVLLKLEAQLPFDFYAQEWKQMGEGRDKRRYREMTIAEQTLPKLLMAAFLVAGLTSTAWGVMKVCNNG